MTSYAERHQAFTYTGSNGNEILAFLDDADNRVWSIVSQDSTQITVHGDLTVEPDTREITIPTGQTLTTQVRPGTTILSGPWTAQKFAAMFVEVPDAP